MRLVPLLLLAALPLHPADDAPSWLRLLAPVPHPAYDATVPAVVLLDEERTLVEENGRLTTTRLGAIKVLTREGRDAAAARQVYLTQTGKVKEMRAWLLSPSGQVRRYGKDEALDIALNQDDVYNESRVRVITARGEAEPGAVFGYEVVSEDRSVFTQSQFEFQSRLPVLAARYSLTLPPSWKAEAVTFNHAPVAPVVSGTTTTWELANLPFLKDEPASPAVSALAPRLAVSLLPPAGANVPGRVIRDWADVSRWLTELNDPQSVPDEAIAAKAKSLTAGVDGEFARIQAIGRYVQRIKYVAIQTGLGRGGGYRPHAAAEVFAKSYGDCKDKANLMRAMLKAINVTAYPVGIFSGDRSYVRPGWASPQQFNHAILAVKVGDAVKAPAIATHPSLGRLLFFDPTDEFTPVGDLPEHEQGSHALVVAGDAGSLVEMPYGTAEHNLLDRTVELALDPSGAATARVREQSQGHPATLERQLHRGRSALEYQKLIEHWVARAAPGTTVSKVEPKDSAEDGRFTLDVEFASPRFGQSMQGRLLVFKPAVVPNRAVPNTIEAKRTHPILLDATAIRETVRVKLPAGYAVDEMPDPAALSTDFGRYTNSYRVDGETLIFTRALELKPATIPAAQYGTVRDFFARMNGADDAAVVLIKK